MKTKLLFLSAVVGLLSITSLHAHANEVNFISTSPASTYSLPSLTDWNSGTLAGDTFEVDRLYKYGDKLIGQNYAGYFDMSQFTLATGYRQSASQSQINQLYSNIQQLMPSEQIRKRYYTELTPNRHDQYFVKVKKTIGVYKSPKFNKRPAYVIRKHRTLPVNELIRIGNAYRFQFGEDNNYFITADKRFVKLIIKY